MDQAQFYEMGVHCAGTGIKEACVSRNKGLKGSGISIYSELFQLFRAMFSLKVTGGPIFCSIGFSALDLHPPPNLLPIQLSTCITTSQL